MRYTLQQVADEIGVSVEDVALVADVELGGPPDYSPDDETVTDEGRRRLVEHFYGGTDPA